MDDDLSRTMAEIADETSPVGMNALYVHALILQKLESMEKRLVKIEDLIQKKNS